MSTLYFLDISHIPFDLCHSLILNRKILKNEKETGKTNYQIIDQIFTYVQKELGWRLPEKEEEWDFTPLDIMKEVFPHIESTKWYALQISTAKNMLDVIKKDRNAKQ